MENETPDSVKNPPAYVDRPPQWPWFITLVCLCALGLVTAVLWGVGTLILVVFS